MSEIQSIDSSTYAYKALTALASISQAAENDERFISCGTKYLYSLGNWRTSRVSSVMYQLRKAGFLRSAVHVHSDGRSRRPCADQYITSLGMAFLKRNNIPFGTVTRPDVPVINHPSSTTSMTENQKLDEVPTGQDLNRNPVSAPLVLTETERVSAELLASRAQNVGSNGKSEKRVSNPAEILLAEGIVENLPMALSIISVLKQHGILSLVAETENDDNPRYIYVVNYHTLTGCGLIKGIQASLVRHPLYLAFQYTF